MLHLRCVSAELLPQPDGRRILQVRPPRLDHSIEGDRFLGERGAQPLQRRDESIPQGQRRRHVERRGNHVVARLAQVDVIVGVYRRLAPQLAAQQLAGAIGDDLVGVHVCRGAGTSLEHVHGEVVI